MTWGNELMVVIFRASFLDFGTVVVFYLRGEFVSRTFPFTSAYYSIPEHAIGSLSHLAQTGRL